MRNGRRGAIARNLALLLAIAGTGVAQGAVPEAGRRPNVVLFLADDMGYGDIGAHGDRRVRTPNLDAFARQAVELEQFRVSPVCSPTRASLMTGRYSFRTGVFDVFGKACEMEAGEVTVAEALRPAGYATGMFGKWHLGAAPDHSPNAQGFEEALYSPGPAMRPKEYFDPRLIHNGRSEERKGYCMDVFADAAVDFLRRNKARPFFVYVAANLIHTPLVVSEELSKPFADAGAAESTSKIYGMIQSLDAAFGRIRSALADLGLEDNTFLIFTSDNGPCSGSAPLDRHMAGLHGLKGTVYDNGIRVPCFMRWPGGFKAPASVGRQLAHIDVMPTILDACGASAPEGVRFDGRSLLPLLRQPAAAWEKRSLFFQWDSGQQPRRGHAYAVVTEPWKLVQPTGMDAANQKHIRDRYAELCKLQGRGDRSIEGPPRFELYDISKDPGETKDLAAQHGDIVASMRGQYEAWFDDVCPGDRLAKDPAAALRGWRPDEGLAAFNRIANEIYAASRDGGSRAQIAKGLAAILSGDGPTAVKRFACEQLAIVGGEAEVGALAELLNDEALETPARGALERIGGPKVAGALRAAYEKSEKAQARAALLGSLGKLGDAQAIPLAKAALAENDARLREAARVALGEIGGKPAAAALLGVEATLAKEERQSWGSALLACIEGMGAPAARADESVAVIIRQALERLLDSAQPEEIRAAAFAAKVRTAGPGGLDLVLEALRGQDSAMLNGAFATLREENGARLRMWHRPIMKACDTMAATGRDGLLDAYAAADIRVGAGFAMRMINDEVPERRQKALRALGLLGSEPDFDALFERMVGSSAEDRAAAADGLSNLRAASTGGRLIALLPVMPTESLPAVTDVLARRGARSAVPALLSLARAKDTEAAKAAMRAVAKLGDVSDIPGLVDVVDKGGPGAAGAAQFLAKIARAEPEAAKERLAMALATASAPTQETISKIMALATADVAGLGRNLAPGGKAEGPLGLKADGASKGPAAAIDGNPQTYWDEENGQPEYRLRVTLPKQEMISRLRITGYEQHHYSPKDFLVLCDSREVKKVMGAEYADNRLLVELPPTRCTVLELVITGYYGGSPAIRELEIFGAVGPGPKSRPREEARAFTWDKRPDSLALTVGGKVVWRLQHGADTPFPHFDHMALAGWDNLVSKSPKDHVHHYAHWFSWKLINGVNYWEFDKATGRPVGATRCSDVSAETRPDGSAKIAMKLSYAPPQGKPILSEDRILDISAPGARGDYRIDWRMEWTAGDAPVLLDRTPPPGEPDGKPHGGYGGLSIRFAENFGDWSVVDSGGVKGMEGHGKRASASDFSGAMGGRDCGVAILDHPRNPNAPTPWFLVMNPGVPFAYTNPAFLFDSPKTIKAGEKLLLRYRVILHQGRWDPPALKRAMAAYEKEVP